MRADRRRHRSWYWPEISTRLQVERIMPSRCRDARRAFYRPRETRFGNGESFADLDRSRVVIHAMSWNLMRKRTCGSC